MAGLRPWVLETSEGIGHAWVLAAIGGLLPIVGRLFKVSLPGGTELANGLWASLLLGVAAALLGVDKAFG